MTDRTAALEGAQTPEIERDDDGSLALRWMAEDRQSSVAIIIKRDKILAVTATVDPPTASTLWSVPVTAALAEKDEDWKSRYEEECKIVDRVWRALGITTFEEAEGREISEIVAAWKARAEKAEAQLALPVAGEVEKMLRRLNLAAVIVRSAKPPELNERRHWTDDVVADIDSAAALLRRFGRVPKLETTGYELERLLKRTEERILIGGDMIKLNAGTLLRFLRDYGTLLSHISADGATEVENG